jgi:hypothetical protein
MTRFDTLLEIVARHQQLAAENYGQIRAVAEHVREGFCAHLDASGGDCVYLAPPVGPFEPRAYGDEAFGLPPKGFRPIGPITFGLIVRVSPAPDWVRIALVCSKEGEAFNVEIADGKSHAFTLPLSESEDRDFFDMLYAHLADGFNEQVRQYEEGEYGGREIGFEMSPPVVKPVGA